MADLVTSNIENLKPYEPGKPIEELERELGIRDSVKLASNENPLGPSPRASQAIRDLADSVHFYPDGGAYRLRHALAEKLGVQPEEIVVGNGSNEVLTIAARTFSTPRDAAVVADYSFIAYRLILAAHGVETRIVPTGSRFEQDLDQMAAACDERTRILYLANPNNPTGVQHGGAEMRAFLAAVPAHVVVVVDEAYVEYVQDPQYASALEMRDVRERLIVCRTFSKIHGLAGLRIGYGVAVPPLVDYMNRVREPFNTNLIAQAAALAALEDSEHVERSVASNEAGRRILRSALRDLGWDAIGSRANFLLVRGPVSGREVYERLLRRGVIVRPVAGYGLPDWVRITVGTRAQNDRLLDALREVR